MRADRLIALLLRLQNQPRVTVPALARHLDVSQRTILRDIDALSGLGVPVYTDRGRTGGVRLLEGYATQLNALSPLEAEAMALVGAPSILGDTGLAKPLANALQKITAAVPAVHQLRAQHARHRLLFDTTPWFSHPTAEPILDQLRGAVWADRVCRLEYERADGVAKHYRIDPYALVAKIDVWYLVADTARGMRVFRVDRVRRATVLDDTFARDARFDLSRYWNSWCKRFEADGSQRFLVELWLTPAGKRHLLERFGAWHAAALATLDDHTPRQRIRLDLENETIAINTLVELGRDATLIRPKRLRSRLLRRARDVIAACGASD
jgi:predicted DNA-binding transcriptional regulator YafY